MCCYGLVYLFSIFKSIYCAGLFAQLKNFLKGNIKSCNKSLVNDSRIGEKYVPASTETNAINSPVFIKVYKAKIRPTKYPMKINPSIKNSNKKAFKKERKGHKLVILEMFKVPISLCSESRIVAFCHKLNGVIKIK